MPTHASRYRSDAAADYSHRFHAGNVGDVWKHCVLVTVLFAAWQHLEARRLDKEAADLSARRGHLRAVYRHLVLEQEFLAGPARVEAIATRQLHMKAPTGETSTVIERVTVTPPPTSAVVATR